VARYRLGFAGMRSASESVGFRNKVSFKSRQIANNFSAGLKTARNDLHFMGVNSVAPENIGGALAGVEVTPSPGSEQHPETETGP
jgi:hypothetical protein